jgi:hypothetical protein
MAVLPAREIRAAFKYRLAWISSLAIWGLASLSGQSSFAASPAGDLYKHFQSPPAGDSLMPYWYWNSRITAEETRRQIRAMKEQGVFQAVVFPWDGMEQRYLSEDYWAQFGKALEIAKELGFTLNVADEYDWPSGHAWDIGLDQPELSRVLSEHPEYRMHRLEYTEHTLEGPLRWNGDARAYLTVAARLNGGAVDAETLRLIQSGWQVPEGKWLITIYERVPAVGGHNTRVDLLNPKAVDAYIALVYEEYARRFPQYLGTTLKLTLADHEGAYGVSIPYTPDLWRAFEQRHGYDVRAKLPLLVHQAADAGKVRQDFLDTISQLYVDSFTGKVADWCRRHNLRHATSLYEEQMYIQVGQAGDMFRHWRAGSAVEIDALLERARMPIDFKEAGSVAHFDNKPFLVENQGLQGHSTYFSLEKARLGTNMALLWGANRLIPYFAYDPNKVTWPPQWFMGQPFRPYFHNYARYVNRIQFMNGQGEHVAPVLLYYPLESAFANSEPLFTNVRHRDLLWSNSMDQTQNFYSALQLVLARAGQDFHIADAKYLSESKLRDRALQIGNERFRVLILPPMTRMDDKAAEAVAAFARAGGVVFAVGDQPAVLKDVPMRRIAVREHPPFMDRLNYMEQIEVPAGIQEDLRPLLAQVRQAQPPEIAVEGDCSHLFFSHRRMKDLDWYWMVNDSETERDVEMAFPLDGTYERWDAETGERRRIPTRDRRMTLHFGPWDAFFVVRGALASAAAPLLAEPSKTVLRIPDTGWKFTPDTPVLRVPYAERGGEEIWLAPERLSNPRWWLTGPFPYDDHKGFYTEYPPEKEFQPNTRYPGAYGDVAWQWRVSPDYIVNLRDELGLRSGQTLGVYYAYVNVYSPEERDGQLVVAFADSLAAWWNGKRILREHRHPKWLLMRDPWAQRPSIHIQKGWNSLLLKIGPSLMTQTMFMARIADRDGLTPRDLIYARDRSEPVDLHKAAEEYTVRIPPGAAASGSKQFLWTDIPEKPVEFPTATVPFRLQSWTDSALAFYSGSAAYETVFEVSAADAAKELWLDLGSVGVAAEVYVNQRKAGERVWRPYRVNVTGLVKPGVNSLKVVVANSDAGWQSQGGTIYPKGSWGLKYSTERDRLPTIRPNGLEGPVRLLTR